MKRLDVVLCFAVSCFALVSSAGATPPPTLVASAPGTQAASLTTGLDGAVAATAGWSIAPSRWRRTLLFADATFPVGDAIPDDLRLRAGGELDLWRHDRFALRFRYAPSLTTARTPAVDAVSIGTELDAIAAWSSPRWAIGLELGVARQWLTHMTLSDWYREHEWEGARDGWYADTATTLRANLRAAARLGSLEVMLAAGLVRAGAYDILPPFHVQAGVAVIW